MARRLISSATGAKIQVWPGQFIQATINKASPGDTIVVERGTYTEQLTIDKDGIALVGHGAILVPPSSAASNLCSGLAGDNTQAGICVTGYDVVLAPFLSEHRKVISVGKPVKGVSINRFQINNFSGQNVAIVGGQDVSVTRNDLTNGGQYGLLSDGSKNTIVSTNHISGYIIALCIQTPAADVVKNDVRNCCIGAFVDPFIDDAKIHDNPSNPTCPPGSVFGIIISGAVNTDVQHNIIKGKTNGGFTAGFAIFDDQSTGTLAIASGNNVVKNIFRDNTLDLFVDTEGTGNVIEHNICSTPEELYAKHK
ncbi:uncharacterized protein N7473_007055 [Penicillium subrubescens]|uniref:uncharacterized protein n=1 Tax=Penicillium subrubescens TaxID=1316194 RepID=UPI0025452E19|nr:uncharacterized protein N7473_007055 [Penicillium subrubescens]KAJ5890827.1 hypothetical protein N7473_007055 [Penicillium subrubescens]